MGGSPLPHTRNGRNRTMSKNEKLERLQKKALRAVYRATYNDTVGNKDAADIQRYRLWHLCEQIAAVSGLFGVVETARVFSQFVG